MGCVRVLAEMDQRSRWLGSASRARRAADAIVRWREDAAVFLGDDGKCLGGLAALLRELAEAGCAMGPWRV